MLYNYYWAWAIENTRCCTYTMYWTNQPNPDQKSSQHEELNNKKTRTRDITFCCCSSVDDLQFLRFDELSMLLVIYPFGVVIMYPFVDLPHLKSLFSRFHWLRYELFWWHTRILFFTNFKRLSERSYFPPYTDSSTQLILAHRICIPALSWQFFCCKHCASRVCK